MVETIPDGSIESEVVEVEGRVVGLVKALGNSWHFLDTGCRFTNPETQASSQREQRNKSKQPSFPVFMVKHDG